MPSLAHRLSLGSLAQDAPRPSPHGPQRIDRPGKTAPSQDLPPTQHGGYQSAGPIQEAAFNIIVGGTLLLINLPLFIVIPLLVYLDDGWPVFYRGERLGKDKKPFQMYKFRTLVKDAESRLGGTLVTSSHRLETRFGRILRETRLDELPQLINVLKGDMRLVGPRPERRLVYETQCKTIPNYERRFRVKPGIIGYSQLFTPHSAPKRVRALIDNYYVSRPRRWQADAGFFVFAILWLARRSLIKIAGAITQVATRMRKMGTAADARTSERVTPRRTWVHLTALPEDGSDAKAKAAAEPPSPLPGPLTLVDIAEGGFALTGPCGLEGQRFVFTLGIEGRFPPRKGIKRRRLHGTATLLRSRPETADATAAAPPSGPTHPQAPSDPDAPACYRHVLLFDSLPALEQLVLHQYFLRRSIF